MPEKPPPATTNVSIVRRSSGSATTEALLEHVDHVVADAHRVGERLERQRVLGQAGDAAEVGDVAERENEVIERAAHAVWGVSPAPSVTTRRVEIDALDLAHEQRPCAAAAGAAG